MTENNSEGSYYSGSSRSQVNMNRMYDSMSRFSGSVYSMDY